MRLADLERSAFLFKELDAVSKTRALTDAESRTLENAQKRILYGRSLYGFRREIIRLGLDHIR